MIIGIKEKDNVILAFSAFDGFMPVSVKDSVNSENVGLWKVKNNPHTIMGCAFSTPESDAFRYEENMFQGEMDYDKLSEEIVPAMEEFAKDKEYIGNENNRFDELLIAQKGRLFEITYEHLVVEINSFVVVASSSFDDFTKGILHATDGEPALDRIVKTFEFVSRERQRDCYPISVMDTATGKLKVLERAKN